MKGKNKLILVLFAMMTVVATGMMLAFGAKPQTVKYANAASLNGFTAELDGGVIFSAERVYLSTGDRAQELKYTENDYTFNAIQTNNGTEYFGDYKLYQPTEANDYSHKDIIKSGDFVLVDDKAIYTAETPTGEAEIKQGIMVTLGGYYFDENRNILLNGESKGAGMGFVSAQATLNGTPITLPGVRDYNSGSNHDFTWFITPSDATEGHYVIDFTYMVNGQTRPIYTFDFYLLLQSSYENESAVNGLNYSSKPTMFNANTAKNSTASNLKYEFFSGETLNYPMITFDYSRYDLTYTHTNGDVQKTVNFDYDEANNRLSLATKVYNEEEVVYYPIKDFGNSAENENTIITLMFVDNGLYDFDFDYIYKHQNEKIVIPKEQIAFSKMTLTIHGYQLKYSKAGFSSADMSYMEIYQNGTMFILVNGFEDASSKTAESALGINYKLIADEFKRTGEISMDTSKTGSVLRPYQDKAGTTEDDDIDNMTSNYITASDKLDTDLHKFVSNVQYQKTDRGLWLTLNDEFYLKNELGGVQSFYYYNPTDKINEEYIVQKSGDEYVKRKEFTKVTTFTATGYYLVQVKYSYGTSNIGIQYFAFQITSATPMLNLYKTEATSYDEDIESESFYAREYTNQNVYANWAETDVFESKILGKLYYSNGRYPSEEDLRAVADGAISSSITRVAYNKNALITNSGSYLLVLEVDKSATRTYTYFTIDKEKISGLEVYEVATNSIDNKAVYSIKRDAKLNYITHTSKGLIDTNFTLSWADKNSGARINASYRFTPFVKTLTSDMGSNTITITSGSTTYKYIMNEYSVSETSKSISINKPLNLNSALDVNNVLTDQGIYEFTLVDEAGNILHYIVIVDRTEGIVNATYGEDKTIYNSGEMVADYVELEWGTHKAINLLSVDEGTTLNTLLNGDTIDDYYSQNGSNFSNIYGLFKKVGGNNLFVVPNAETQIRLFNRDNYYIVTNTGTKQIRYPNGATTTGWDSLANELFSDVSNMGIRINPYEQSVQYYTLGVIGGNQVSNEPYTNFQVVITPDKAQGSVYSSQDGGEFETSVRAAGKATAYLTADNKNEDVYIKEYYDGQASDDGVFVFEWLAPSVEDNFEVTEVKYNYYQLMDQAALNQVTSKENYLYYPYRYISTNYILSSEVGNESAQYTKEQRGSKSIYRSYEINLGYETYYNDNNELVSKRVTQTGLYIITRTISIKANDGSTNEVSQFSYAFFVDRNMVVGYSISNINEKIVGQFIHTAMPNSESATGVQYDNFTKQGLKTQTQKYINNNGTEETVEYKIYLDTNKLPTRIQVPSGKYVSGDAENKTVNITSHINLKLQLSVYFYDTYQLLSLSQSQPMFIKLMDKQVSSRDKYIDLSFKNIENPAILTEFRNSRIHADDNSLSLPGVYVFVINDTVGKVLNNRFEVMDYNTFSFAIKLTNQAPTTNMYAYAEIDGNASDKIYVNSEKVLYTNQEFVDFEIMVEDLNAYQAQVDINSIEIYRSSKNGSDQLWLRLKSNASGSGFVADTNGIIQDTSRVHLEDNKYIVKLDTGLKVEDNQIVDYKEYVYSINIKYILKNSGTQYYTYKNGDVTNAFYKSTYVVNIDRSPSSNNLDALMQNQGEYFKNYHNWLATENDTKTSNKVNGEIAYRSAATVGDYYGLINNLYYNYIQNNKYDLASQAMYAMNVNSSTTFSKSGLSMVYFRELDFDADIEANTRMGLLPIIDTYYGNSTGFYTFSENLTAYQTYPLNTISNNVVGNNVYYRALLGDVYETNYDSNYGKFYEIIEKDLAGNYTQYVVYFAPDQEQNVEFTIEGKNITDSTDTTVLAFKNSNIDQKTFIGIANVSELANLVGEIESTGQKMPYYANINIYNSGRENIQKIYTNSTSTAENIESLLFDLIKEQGNYIIEYINVFGQKHTVIVNNYTSDEHYLNTDTLQVKTDYMGQKYISLSSVNSKIDDNTYWYVTSVEIRYNDKSIAYSAQTPNNGISTLELSSGEENEVWLDTAERDRLNLAKGLQYLVILTDVAGRSVVVPLSTSDSYYAYKLITPKNIYSHENITYTSNTVQFSYNTDLYNASVNVYLNDNTIPETFVSDADRDSYYTGYTQSESYRMLTLIPDQIVEPANHYGSLRRFEIVLQLKETDDTANTQTFNVWIDTRVTDFSVENINKVDKIEFVKSTLKNDKDENGIYQDYNIMDLMNNDFYSNLIAETVNVSWTQLESKYFNYNYQLFEFVNKDEYVELTKGSNATSFTIAPKENTTGKYILKVTIKGKDNNWIATRVYSIYMSTTITGLYEVKDGNGILQNYASVTNLDEIINSIGENKGAMATALGFASVADMESIFASFGHKTAIPMYISNTQLTLHSNQDNGVSSKVYQPTGSSYATISFYHIYRSNYRTFAVIMEVYATDKSQDILSTLSFATTSSEDAKNLLGGGTATTIYNPKAEYYRLNFNSYNKNTGASPLERHNKIIIDVYYNNIFAKRVKGDNSADGLSHIEFKNAGSYKLQITDVAGNVQYFRASTLTADSFTVVVMKDILYTINNEAPIQYAYYDKPITLQINRYNDATGKNNYDINSIALTAVLNGKKYTGYSHPTESATYIFKEYGTYLITIKAKLLETGEQVSSQLVFTILNPNEARTALDFTSIYGYNILSVHSITKTAEKDVTDKFIDLLQDKSNDGGVNVYNKLLTYERVIEALGSTTQGKIKFRVLYEVDDDDLLPARRAEFTFTLNNETAKITSSIKPGDKTTKTVTLKFNAANIYDQIGECYLVINDEKVLKISEDSANTITKIEIKDVGKYYVQLVGDSGNVATSFNFTIKEPLNTVSIILIVVVSAIVIGLIGTFIWLRTRMKVR